VPLRNALQELVLHGFPGWSVSIPVIVMGFNLAYTFNGQGSVVAVHLSRSSSYLFGGAISNQYRNWRNHVRVQYWEVLFTFFLSNRLSSPMLSV